MYKLELNNRFTFQYDSITIFQTGTNGPKDYLVGIDENWNVVFLSGNFYHTDILDDFDFNCSLDEIEMFIKIRMFNIHPQ